MGLILSGGSASFRRISMQIHQTVSVYENHCWPFQDLFRPLHQANMFAKSAEYLAYPQLPGWRRLVGAVRGDSLFNKLSRLQLLRLHISPKSYRPSGENKMVPSINISAGSHFLCIWKNTTTLGYGKKRKQVQKVPRFIWNGLNSQPSATLKSVQTHHHEVYCIPCLVGHSGSCQPNTSC